MTVRNLRFRPTAAQTSKLPVMERNAMTSSAAMYATLGEISRSVGGGEEDGGEEFWKGSKKGDSGWDEFLVW